MISEYSSDLQTPSFPRGVRNFEVLNHFIGGRGGIKMASTSAPSANEPARTSF